MFCLLTVPPQPDLPSGSERVAKLAGFCLHAGVAARADQRDKIERLCRYIARPVIAEQRLSYFKRAAEIGDSGEHGLKIAQLYLQ